MRILHLAHDHINSPWDAGGSALRLHEVYRRLVPRHEVLVATGGWRGCRRQEVIDGVRYWHLGAAASYVQSRLEYCARAPGAIAASPSDVVVTEISGSAPCHPPLFTSRPCIGMFHHFAGDTAATRHGLVGHAIRSCERALLAHQKYLVVVAEGIRERAASLAKRARLIEVVPNGVDPRVADGPLSEAPFFLSLGRVDIGHKGLDLLVAAFGAAADRLPSVRLVIAGGGRDEAPLRRLVEAAGLNGRVEFAGRVSEQRKSELLRSCLAVCMPSRFEGWGIVAIEAALCGKPVIGHDILGLREAVRDGETGVLVPAGDTAAFAAELVRLAGDGALRRRLGEAGRRWGANFTWERTAREQEAFYEKVLALVGSRREDSASRVACL